jgi:hypothetical protein
LKQKTMAAIDRLPCLTEISTGALMASALVVSGLLWLAIGSVV